MGGMDTTDDFEIFQFHERPGATESPLLAIRLDNEEAPTKMIFEYADGTTEDSPFPPNWPRATVLKWLEMFRGFLGK
jgi:hypothetical protein